MIKMRVALIDGLIGHLDHREAQNLIAHNEALLEDLHHGALFDVLVLHVHHSVVLFGIKGLAHLPDGVDVQPLQSLGELGGKEEDIPYLAHTAAFGNGNQGTLGGFVKLQEQDMANIYRLML